MKQRTRDPNHDDFILRAQRALDNHAQTLDAHVATRLARMREQALEESRVTPLGRALRGAGRWAGGLVGVAASAMALWLLLARPDAPPTAPTLAASGVPSHAVNTARDADEPPIIDAPDPAEEDLVEHLDFYLWLAEEIATGRQGGQT